MSGPAKCFHGYFELPSNRCPWCCGFDESNRNAVPVVGHGNGWLLRTDEAVCESCGGPSCAGWGIGSPESIAAEPPRLCYPCRSGENTKEAIEKRAAREAKRGVRRGPGAKP